MKIKKFIKTPCVGSIIEVFDKKGGLYGFGKVIKISHKEIINSNGDKQLREIAILKRINQNLTAKDCDYFFDYFKVEFID